MRKRLSFPVILSVSVACNGAYTLGELRANSQGGNGGSPGTTSDAGQVNAEEPGGSPSGHAGSDEQGGSPSGHAGSDEQGGSPSGYAGGEGGEPTVPMGAGSGGTSSEEDEVGPHWLASATFSSSATSQYVLSLIDLEAPEREGVLVEGDANHPFIFSPNGEWVLYGKARSSEQRDLYLLNTASSKLLDPVFLLTAPVSATCTWAPDSSKLACLKDTRTQEDLRLTLVTFEVHAQTVGPERSIDFATGNLMFLDGDTLIYADSKAGASVGESPEFARVRFEHGTPSEPEALGVEAGYISQQCREGARALVRRTAERDGTTYQYDELVDFDTGRATPLPHVSAQLDDACESAVGYELLESSGPEPFMEYSYYSVRGTTLEKVARVQVPGLPRFLPPVIPTWIVQVAGNTSARQGGDQVVVTTIEEERAIDRVVPGDYQDVAAFAIDRAARWLYIQTVARDEPSGAADPSTARHWLSRVSAGVPAPAELIGEGYLVSAADFSPDGTRLALSGYDSTSTTPVSYHLWDLTSDRVTDHSLEIPFNWAEVTWSFDSSFISYLGGNPIERARQLYIVDALRPTAPPRLIVECSSNPAEAPGCPGMVLFQPRPE